MDYKYIEQLLERYWECQTTLEEEAILRAFFSQDDVPASLLPYRDIFVYAQRERSSEPLGEAFDRKVFARLGTQKAVKAQRIGLTQRLRPLFKAVAIVAIVLTLSNAIQMSITAHHGAPDVVVADTNDSAAVQVATIDSIAIDSIHHHSSLAPAEHVERTMVGQEAIPKD